MLNAAHAQRTAEARLRERPRRDVPEAKLVRPQTNLLTVPIVTAAIAATFDAASADATVDPSADQYQTHPNNEQHCSGCELFIPAETDPTKNDGTCKTVKGAISPQGWCELYSPKSK
jgi:hypothetical protein